YRLLGASEADGLSTQQVREAIDPAYLEAVRTELLQALKEGRRSRLLEAKLIGMNHVRIDVEIMAAPIPFGGSDALQIIIRDVTERKRADETRHEAERLRIALEKERELGELKTRLMITISHEFRTPLAIVNSSAELLDKFLERMQPEQRARHLLKIQAQIRRLTEMIEDITLIVQSTFEQVVPQFEPTDFAILCADAILQMDVLIQTQDRIVLEIEDNLPKLMLDQRRMKYVLTNLLSNALKYSPATSSILLQAHRDGHFVLLRITDHGIGIPASEQNHIFEPFYRAQNVSGIGGTGLGLSVVKDIIELHNGTIGLASELGQGTQVTILLPMKADQNPSHSPNQASA
ncbi:MAG TPA: HAMP domain-containing sensor histidine kinase, partial [Tepidisphaeraceae bacterium]|nr:HAMP domain-containing sensor histidine kinase [Tepidisphaeraceae bacterium]